MLAQKLLLIASIARLQAFFGGRVAQPKTMGRALTGHMGLAVAVLDLAARDAQKTDGYSEDAREFLVSTWAAELLGLLCGALGVEEYGSDDLADLARGHKDP